MKDVVALLHFYLVDLKTVSYMWNNLITTSDGLIPFQALCNRGISCKINLIQIGEK